VVAWVNAGFRELVCFFSDWLFGTILFVRCRPQRKCEIPSVEGLSKVLLVGFHGRELIQHVGTVCLRGFESVTNIYVGNLSFKATEDEVKQAFSRFGKVARVSIVMDRETGRSRGFAFVEMPDAEEAKAAIAGLNEQEVAGRRISCNEARPREERPSGGGRGGYGGGGGGGYGGGGRDGGGYGGGRDGGKRPYRDH
jgi:uncharacterized membrane protein YgcG